MKIGRLKCDTTKDEAEFDVRADTGGRRTMCRACRRAYQRDRYRAEASPTARCVRLEGRSDLFLCTRCGEEKPASAFPRRRRGSRRLQSRCRACFKAYNAAQYVATRDVQIVRIRRNRRRTVQRNRERIRARTVTVERPEGEPRERDL